MGTGSPFWRKQTQWSINPSNTGGTASDDNLGCGASSDTAPLLTYAEWLRRMDYCDFRGLSIVVRILSNTVEPSLGFGQFLANRTGSGSITFSRIGGVWTLPTFYDSYGETIAVI